MGAKGGHSLNIVIAEIGKILGENCGKSLRRQEKQCPRYADDFYFFCRLLRGDKF